MVVVVRVLMKVVVALVVVDAPYIGVMRNTKVYRCTGDKFYTGEAPPLRHSRRHYTAADRSTACTLWFMQRDAKMAYTHAKTD